MDNYSCTDVPFISYPPVIPLTLPLIPFTHTHNHITSPFPFMFLGLHRTNNKNKDPYRSHGHSDLISSDPLFMSHNTLF